MDRQTLEQALAACENEAVHIPGAIQPHGALISLDSELTQVRQVSANLGEILGIAAQDALAMSPEALLGRWLEAIREHVDDDTRHGVLVATFDHGDELRRFRLLPYRTGSRLVIELEPLAGDPERWLFSVLADWQSALQRFASKQQLLDTLTAQVRQLAGYDRVMIYRFDEDWHGSVVAESRGEDIGSYLGHHFPASDIPAQVRRLYSIKRVRDIPDASAASVALLPPSDPVDPAPLDLSLGILRAVAPIHAQYLANMGVGASMSIALHVRGRLWGLLACHAQQPRVLSPVLRDALRAMTQSTAFQIELIEAHADSNLLQSANERRALMINEEGEFSRPETLIERHGDELLKLFRADGVAMVLDDTVASAGRIPNDESLRALAEGLAAMRSGRAVWVTHELENSDLAGPCADSDFAGLLAVSLPWRASGSAWLLLFRLERPETRLWAGEPEKSVDHMSGKLNPRKSFTAWKETVKGKSKRWRPIEERAAFDLAGDLATLLAASEISRLNAQLAEMASHDHLTGLWNRYRMEEAIDQEIAVARRYQRRCALLMVDIDRFKQFNDTWGHDAGDKVLVEVARAVSSQLRDTDKAGRWGGEEFVVLAPQTGHEGAACLAERLRGAIEALDLGEYGRVTASFGVAVHTDGEQRRDLLKRADLALYDAKEGGRNRVEVSEG